MRMISYAQNYEDVLLDRLFPTGSGFYIDVGANDPVHQSVTKHFYDRGWHGLNIEPEPGAFRRLCAERRRDINLNLGISNREGNLTFFEASAASGWSTFSPAQAENLRRRGLEVIERSVPVSTLASLCERYVPRGLSIDFLKIDAESHEREVIEGADWTRWRPRVVLIEANGSEEWEPLMLRADYRLALFDGINRFYLRAEDAHLLPRLGIPANFTDDFIPYEYYQRIEALRTRLALYEDLGPSALGVARWLQRTSARFPRLASVVKRAVRLVG
ncbi:MAG: FkbM family methyltransferase [Isosphaeraceae bacterium]|nr:FkbM family methyltransferase [Isosphaeraceae bacterium]